MKVKNELKLGGKAYQEVEVRGDGNCAFRAFSMGLLDLIKKGELVISPEMFEKIKLVINDSNFKGKKFATHIFGPYATHQTVTRCIKNLQQSEIDTYQTVMSSILRILPKHSDDQGHRAVVDESLLKDGEWAGSTELYILSKMFGVHVKFCELRSDKLVLSSDYKNIASVHKDTTYGQDSDGQSLPEIAVVHSGNHWNYLQPKELSMAGEEMVRVVEHIQKTLEPSMVDDAVGEKAKVGKGSISNDFREAFDGKLAKKLQSLYDDKANESLDDSELEAIAYEELLSDKTVFSADDLETYGNDLLLMYGEGELTTILDKYGLFASLKDAKAKRQEASVDLSTGQNSVNFSK